MQPTYKRRNMGHHRQFGGPNKIGEVEKLQSLIIMVGDKPVHAVAMIHDVADVIVRDYQTHMQTILKTFTGCATELSHKPHAYAALLSTITSLNTDIGQAILDAIQSHCSKAFIEDRVSYVRTLFRFFAFCVEFGVIPFELFHQQLNLIADSLTNGQLDHRNDMYASLLLSTLVFLPKEKFLQNDPFLILDKLSNYIERRTTDSHRQALVYALQPWDPTCSDLKLKDYLKVHLHQVQALYDAPSPFSSSSSSSYSFALPIVTTWPLALPKPSTPLTFDPIHLPPHLTLSHFLAPPYVLFRLFDTTIVTLPGSQTQFKAHVPSLLSPERFVTVELIYDLLNNIQYNHKEGSKWLMDVRLFFLAHTFAFTTDVFGPQHGEHPDAPEFQFEQLLIEVIFSGLFRLPLSQVRPIFYTDVIMGLCKLTPKSIAPALGKAIQLCFLRLSNMEMDGCIRFMDFFSHHLSLFSYVWNWKDWQAYLPSSSSSSSSFSSSSYLFILAVLEKLTRLAYFDRIRSSLPESFHWVYSSLEPKPCLPSSFPLSTTTSSSSSLSNETMSSTHDTPDENPQNVSFHSFFTDQLVDLIKQKTPWEEVQQYLLQFQKNTHCTYQSLRQGTFTAFLIHGQTTFSHTMTVLERYVVLLRALLSFHDPPPPPSSSVMSDEQALQTNDDKEVKMLKAKWDYLDTVFLFWQRHHQFCLIVLDKLIQYRLVLSQDVLHWVFQHPQFHSAFFPASFTTTDASSSSLSSPSSFSLVDPHNMDVSASTFEAHEHPAQLEAMTLDTNQSEKEEEEKEEKENHGTKEHANEMEIEHSTPMNEEINSETEKQEPNDILSSSSSSSSAPPSSSPPPPPLPPPCSPFFFLEILCLTIKKVLHRIDYLEDKLKEATETNEPKEVMDRLELNLSKAKQEKHYLFLLLAEKCLHSFISDPSTASLPETQLTHWHHKLLGSLVTLIRMYIAEFDAPLKSDMLQLLETQASSFPTVSQVLKAILSME